MTIKYDNSDTFHDGVEEMVKRGLTFKANHDTLTITLTGGY